jgi:hypothetical protein|tara:strand:- start:58 stop:276 length:219 start_codon:yes stop_codon:yes gene_type:complete
MIRVIVILLILTQPLKAGCQYSATADVINDKLVNKKEKYVCEEDKSFFVQFWTTDEWARTATMTFLFILENI